MRRWTKALLAALFLSGSFALANASAEPTNVYTPDSSIDKTGAQDVTEALQAFINRVPDNAIVSFPSGARYRIEGTLLFKNRQNLIIDGNGAMFFATDPVGTRVGSGGPRSRQQFSLEEVTDVTIRNLVIKGAHVNGGQDDDAYVSQYEAQHGINIVDSENIEVYGNNITEVFGDFVYVAKSNDVYIHDNFMRRNGRQGIGIGSGENIRIEKNDIADTRRATIDLEPLTANGFVRNVYIRNNKIGDGRLLFIAAAGSPEADTSNIYVEDNELSRPMSMTFRGPSNSSWRRKNLVIQRNYATGGAGSAIGGVLRIENYDNVVVKDNYQKMNQRQPSEPGMYMVASYNSCGLDVTGNTGGEFFMGQVYVALDTYDCSVEKPGAPRPEVRSLVELDAFGVDAGGPGNVSEDVLSCVSRTSCNGFITSGSPTSLETAREISGTQNEFMQTALEGPMTFNFPLKRGMYRLTLDFAELTDIGPRDRRFHINVEDDRIQSGYDIVYKAGETYKATRETVDVWVGPDGLNLELSGGGAIVNFLSVQHVFRTDDGFVLPTTTTTAPPTTAPPTSVAPPTTVPSDTPTTAATPGVPSDPSFDDPGVVPVAAPTREQVEVLGVELQSASLPVTGLDVAPIGFLALLLIGLGFAVSAFRPAKREAVVPSEEPHFVRYAHKF